MSRRVLDLADVYAARLGVESGAVVQDELKARFEHLSAFVLAGEPVKPADVSAEAATAHGELWVLVGFLADARRLLSGGEER